MITHSPKKVFNLLDKSKLDKPQTIQNPIVRVDVGDGTPPITVGGDWCFVHYNRDKEIAHSTQKLQKRFRHLKKQEARRNNLGDDFPNVELLDQGRRATE